MNQSSHDHMLTVDTCSLPLKSGKSRLGGLFVGLIGTKMSALSGSALMMLMMAMVSVSTGAARAQDELRPPKTQDEPSSPVYVVMVIAVLLVGAVVFAASLRSKRTHQD